MKISWSFLILLWPFPSSEPFALSQSSRAEIDNVSQEAAKLTTGKFNTERGPANKIPGTTFFSSVYYRLSKKTPQGSVFTYVQPRVEGAHMLQVDSHPNRVNRYEEGNDWYGEDMWMFVEASDYPGWYELHHKSFPKGICAVSSRKVGSGFHVIVTERRDSKFDVEGTNRKFALWRPIGVNDQYFQLKNKQFPEDVVTNTTIGIGEKLFYVQVDTDPKNAAIYEEGGNNFEETLFFINSQPKFVLNAKIEEFIFPQVPKDISPYKKTSFNDIDYESMTVIGNKARYKVAQEYTDQNTWACIVEGKFQGFNSTTVKYDIPTIGSLSVHSEPERPLSPDGTLTETRKNVTELSMDIEVPSDRFVNFAVYSEWYEDLPLRFDAIMVITGSLDDGTILSSDFIRENLPVDWKNAEGSAEKENTWQINVKGKLLLSFGHHREILTRLSLWPVLV